MKNISHYSGNTLLLLCFIAFTVSACGKKPEFEGIVTYRQQVISKHESVNEGVYNGIFGDTLRWYYKSGSFKEASNGSGNNGIIFKPETREIYTLLQDSAVSRSVEMETRKLDTLYITGRSEVILGHESHEVLKVINGVEHRYWFAPELKVNPANFAGFQASFNDRFYALTGSHYLKYEYESAIFKVERIAVSIEQKVLNDSDFDVNPAASDR